LASKDNEMKIETDKMNLYLIVDEKVGLYLILC